MVSAVDGRPLADVVVAALDTSVVTGADGTFLLDDVVGSPDLVVHKPAWTTLSVPGTALREPVLVELEPFMVKGLRVSQQVAGDAQAFDNLLAIADDTVVNTLVFDTKDRTDYVLYDTDVAFAREIGAVDVIYDPLELIALAKEQGLYTITRITTFKDAVWAGATPESALSHEWLDAADPVNWEYPLDLADEACDLGFDEVQFDYVRFPSGEAAAETASHVPANESDRTSAVGEFLGQARARLHPRGCAVSAAIFGIVMSSDNDERLGQTPETVSAVTDAVSPMLYPSQYNSGWLGYASPYSHPGPVVAHALAPGQDRITGDSLLRPWLQGFSYGETQVLAQIAEADARGVGWIVWNSYGEYDPAWLPPAD